MADKKEVFRGLQRLFKNDVIIRNVGFKKLKVVDLSQRQSNIYKHFQSRFGGLYSSWRGGSGQYSGFGSSYGTQRTLLYNDYDAMDMTDPIIMSALDIISEECLEGSTKIPLIDGSIKTIAELYEEKAENFWVYSLDHNYEKVAAVMCSRVSKKPNAVAMLTIILEDDTRFHCSFEHEWITPDGLKHAADLESGSELKLFDKNSKELKIVKVADKYQCGYQPAYDLVNTGYNHIFAIQLNNQFVFCHNCTLPDEFGEVITIKTEDSDVKNVLNNLFYDIMNIEHNLQMWIRNMCKYGDAYLFLQIHADHGIVNVKPISTYDIERFEYEDPTVVTDVTYKLTTERFMKKEFQNYEIGHFRLNTDSNFLPHGRSILESGRRIWKVLRLMEDAMLIHRIVRAPERRLYYIDVGAIPTSEIDTYMQRVISQTRKTPLVDTATGNLNLKYNVEPVAWYTKIPLLDGRTITIKQLSEEIKSGKENWVYSVDRKDENKIVPGKVIWCDLTKENAKIVRITLDDNSYADMEENHPVMLRDGSYKSAKDLLSNDSLMPFYTTRCPITRNAKKRKDYEKVFNPKKNKYNFTHRVVATELNIDNYQFNGSKFDVHHQDFSRFNNNPSNLDCTMTRKDHIYYRRGFDGYPDLVTKVLENPQINHKVKSVEYIENEDVYCMTVDKYHNFALDTFGGEDRNGFFVKNSITEDYFIPKRGSDDGSRIESLPGMEFNATDDLEYVRKKLMASLKIPPAYFGYEEDICISPNTIIPTLCGNKKSAKQLINEYENGIKNYVYSIDEETHKMVPGEIEWAGMTRRNAQVVKVTLDNGKSIICTPDHNFMLRDGKWVEAQILKKNDSLMPFYSKAINNGIEIYDPSINNYIPHSQLGRLKSDYKPIQEMCVLNHKVISVEFLTETMDTCDLRISKYHNFAVDAGVIVHNSGKVTLSQEDFRFSRTIQKYQRLILSELKKIAIVHLYVLGFKDEEFLNFELSLTNPSTIQEQEKINLWQQKVSLLRDMQEIKLLSNDWMYDHILKMTNDEKETEKSRVLKDMARKYRYEQIEQQGNDPIRSGKDVDDEDSENDEQSDVNVFDTEPDETETAETEETETQETTEIKKKPNYDFQRPMGASNKLNAHDYHANSPMAIRQNEFNPEFEALSKKLKQIEFLNEENLIDDSDENDE